jgi:predicted secreted protein
MPDTIRSFKPSRIPGRAAIAAVAWLAGAALPAVAQTMPPPQNVVHLDASATIELPSDWLTVTFSSSREGPEAAAVQSQLKQALDAALVEARRAAKPGELEVRTGGFAVQPRYTPRGGASGWTGSVELVVEGRDMAAIGALTGRIQTLSIARVQQGLSREAAQRVEGEVTAQAVARFRAKADQSAKLFGFSGWLLREVNVNGEPPRMRVPAVAMRAAAAPMADEALPVEAGKTSVTVSVNGSVQLTR